MALNAPNIARRFQSRVSSSPSIGCTLKPLSQNHSAWFRYPPADDATPTTAADAAPTTDGASGDETTSTAGSTDDGGTTDVAALCDASSDTADLAARQGMLDALTDAWLAKELLTELDGGETISFLGCADGRAEAVHRLPSGTQELLVFTVDDEVSRGIKPDELKQ